MVRARARGSDLLPRSPIYDIENKKNQGAVMKKGVGRPKSDTEGVMVRLPREMIRQLDEVRRNEDDIPTRPEMIRRILADWLDRNPPES
jgi:hypothetical protein